jgi:hypothetical protein
MEKPDTSLYESSDQVVENDQERIGESHQLDNSKDANINMYAENTAENSSENTSGINAEINLQNRQAQAETETEAEPKTETAAAAEEEKRLLLLIQGCSRVMPEEDPARVGEVITRAVDAFSLEWVRQAINEAALCNKRSLQGVFDILFMWEKSTPPDTLDTLDK